jgi:hypothetical protein
VAYLAVVTDMWPILDNMYTDRGQTTETFKLFRNPTQCVTHFEHASRALSLPACRHDDCSPLYNVCAVSHSRLWAKCLGLTPLELAAELTRFQGQSASWFSKFTRARELCMLGYWYVS